jgi:hypothetical protein
VPGFVFNICAMPWAVDSGLSAVCFQADSLPQSLASADHSDLFQLGYSSFINALAYALATRGVHWLVSSQLSSICMATAMAYAGVGKNGAENSASSQLKYFANNFFI